jgi:hypothetical protein
MKKRNDNLVCAHGFFFLLKVKDDCKIKTERKIFFLLYMLTSKNNITIVGKNIYIYFDIIIELNKLFHDVVSNISQVFNVNFIIQQYNGK